MSDKIQKARERLEAKWDTEGECGSCGWHGSLYEHGVDDGEIQEALESNSGFLHLGCVNGDYPEDASSHRGVKIFIGEEKPTPGNKE